MTYNTNGIKGEYKDKTFANDFLVAVDSLHPQILVLQEMYSYYSPLLSRELQKRYPYNSISVFLGSKRKREIACIFSKFPIRSFYRMQYNKFSVDSLFKVHNIPDSVNRPKQSEIYNVVLDVYGKEMLVVCCYLKSNDYSKYRRIHSNRWIDGWKDYYNGYNVASTIRSLNAEMIRDSIVKYNLPTIVCGDMNDFQFSRPIKTIMGDNLKNVWWERGFGYGMTYNKFHLKIRIDHILVSKDFEAVSVDVPHLPFSDHYPIVSDLKFCDKHNFQ